MKGTGPGRVRDILDHEPRYVRVERQRRYLLTGLPEGVSPRDEPPLVPEVVTVLAQLVGLEYGERLVLGAVEVERREQRAPEVGRGGRLLLRELEAPLARRHPARLAQPQDVLHARVVDRRDHAANLAVARGDMPGARYRNNRVNCVSASAIAPLP